MSLHLSDGQLRRIQELQELLLTPLRHPDADSWIAAVHDATTELFGVDRSMLVLPGDSDEVLIDSPNIGAEALEKIREAMTGTRTGANRYDDPMLDRAMRRLAAADVEIWDREIAERVSRVRLEEMPRFYPEVIRPNNLEGMLVMGHSLPEGRAMLHVLPAEVGGTTFRDRGVDVFRLLLPAFKAGSRTFALAAYRWRRLREALDLLEQGIAVYRAGSEEYRNRALRRLLSVDDQEHELITAMARSADRLERELRKGSGGDGSPDASTEVTTATNRYRIEASHLNGGRDGTALTVLVVVRAAVPPLPDEAELQDRYGLTRRQAEVAVLLARGLSNREIGDRLSISRHTARHHAQRVLEKTGGESRKALAIRLLRDRKI